MDNYQRIEEWLANSVNLTDQMTQQLSDYHGDVISSDHVTRPQNHFQGTLTLR